MYISNAAKALLGRSPQQPHPEASPRDVRGAKSGSTRKEYGLKHDEKLTEELRASEEQGAKVDGARKGAWLIDFVHDKWPAAKRDPKLFTRRRQHCWSLLRAARAKDKPKAPGATQLASYYEKVLSCRALKGRGYARTCAKAHVSKAHLKRQRGAGRPILCPELGEELWHWFVDTVRNVKGRIGNGLLLCQARSLKDELQDVYKDLLDAGTITEKDKPKLPKVTDGWIRSWRKRYRVSYKTKTVAYKVPRAVLLKRLGVFWRNNIRIRHFHRRMFPQGKLHFRAYDQKPMYFNQQGDQGTLANLDEWEVTVRECCHATRSRYTVMTKSVSMMPDETLEDVKARSHNSGDPASIAVLFKLQSSGASILPKLHVPDNVLVQFGPKGSYRTDTVVDWLKHDLGEADGDGNLEVVYLDWFAAHLADEVVQLIESKGHVALWKPGGSTPWVATLDTHYHMPYEREYQKQEQLDNIQQLLHGAAMPSTSRQTVLTRASDSWKCLDFEHLGKKSWADDGMTLPLDEENLGPKLRHQNVVFWQELHMDAVQKRIITEIDTLIDQGELTTWSQYRELLEVYDNHPGMVEGEDTARDRMGDPEDDEDDGESIAESDGGGPDDDDDDDVNGHDGAEVDGDEHAIDLGPAGSTTASTTHAAASSSGSSSSSSHLAKPSAAPAPTTEEEEADPGTELPSSAKLDRLAAYAMELGIKEPQVLKVIRENIRRAEQLDKGLHPARAIQDEFRARMDKRRMAMVQRAAQRREAVKKLKTADLELKKAEANAKAAKALGKVEADKAKQQLAECQAQKKTAQEKAKHEQARDHNIRHHFAACLVEKHLEFYVLSGAAKESAAKALAAHVRGQVAEKTHRMTYTPPFFCMPSRS